MLFGGLCQSGISLSFKVDWHCILKTRDYLDTLTTEASFKGKDSDNLISEEIKSTEPPIFSIQMSLYDMPCFNKFAWPNISSFYPLVEERPKGCGYYGPDNLAIKTDKQNEWNLYSQNGILYCLEIFSSYQEYLEHKDVRLLQDKK